LNQPTKLCDGSKILYKSLYLVLLHTIKYPSYYTIYNHRPTGMHGRHKRNIPSPISTTQSNHPRPNMTPNRSRSATPSTLHPSDPPDQSISSNTTSRSLQTFLSNHLLPLTNADRTSPTPPLCTLCTRSATIITNILPTCHHHVCVPCLAEFSVKKWPVGRFRCLWCGTYWFTIEEGEKRGIGGSSDGDWERLRDEVKSREEEILKGVYEGWGEVEEMGDEREQRENAGRKGGEGERGDEDG
ncbi:hypothetical protein EJ04DRAFT_595001, partial [Polyplosphaeria fusca]